MTSRSVSCLSFLGRPPLKLSRHVSDEAEVTVLVHTILLVPKQPLVDPEERMVGPMMALEHATIDALTTKS